jgi:hypothetical protein
MFSFESNSIMASPILFKVAGALSNLGLEDTNDVLPPGEGVRMIITEKTIEKMRSLVGKKVTVPDNGDISID